MNDQSDFVRLYQNPFWCEKCGGGIEVLWGCRNEGWEKGMVGI